MCAKRDTHLTLRNSDLILSIPVSFVESSGCSARFLFGCNCRVNVWVWVVFFFMLGSSVFVFLWSIVWKLRLQAIFKWSWPKLQGDTSWLLLEVACALLITCNPERIWQTCPVQEIYASVLYLPQQDKTSHPYHAQLPLCCQNPSEDETVRL